MPTANPPQRGVGLVPLRIAGTAIGGVVMACGLVGWFSYLGATGSGFDPHDTGPGVTDSQLIGLFFGLWIVPWLIGLALVLLAIAGWLRRTTWVLLGLTALMLVASLVTYLVGAS
ncbi:hypothetical protein ACL03H_21485 [Saccharopolyspora sp. MS10]|uniref:hypothetical protein n=1 Tax=Saccharopolyspora sp. MS10 TaxID=3385973 RepID=UPI0039A01402